MSGSITVLHYRDSTSDKIWAIDSKPNSDGGHDIWYGRRGSSLRYSPTSDSNWRKRLNDKLGKGYTRAEGLTVDPETCRVIALSEEQNSLPSSLWYHVSSKVSDHQMRDWLDATSDRFAEQFCDMAEELEQLPVFQSIYHGKYSGGAEISEGPLALLLLFAFRRHFRKSDTSDTLRGPVQIADDNNQLLTSDFDEFIELIAKGSEFAALRQRCTESDFKKYGVALGACDAPVDLNAICSDTKAAFF